MPRQALVSVVIPAMNEARCLPALHGALRLACDRLPYAFEFVFVDDGSADESPEVLRQLHQADDRVRYLVLSRNFGHQAALSAGLAHASGDAVVMMDGDLQHPPEVIPRLIERWEAGYEVVNTRRAETAGIHPLKRLWSWLFYRVFNRLSHLSVEPGSADFRLVARPVVDALNALPERDRFYRGLVPWLGFRQTQVAFSAPARFAGRSKYTFRRNIRLALEGITAFSFYPLRLVTIFGGTIMMTSVAYGLFAFTAHLFGGRTVPGWTSLILCVLFLGGSQLTAIGVLSEYLGRTLEQVKGRPVYVLRAAVGFPPSAIRREERQGGVPPHHLSRKHVWAEAVPDPSASGR